VAMMEIARRVIGKACDEGPVLNRADLVAEYLRPYTVGLEVEKFWVLCLNRKNRLIEAGGGDKRNGDVDLGASARSVPRGDSRVGLRDSR